MLTLRDNTIYVRLINIDLPPYYKNSAGLPGGLIAPEETAEQSVERHLYNKTGITSNHIHLEQVYTFTAINRDPRNRVVAVAYLGLVPWEALRENEQQDTKTTWWCDIRKVPKLAYDHNEILNTALERFRSRVNYTNLMNTIMSQEFTLTELEQAYETVLGKKIDKRNFRKKIERLKLLKKLKKMRTGLKARPATLYTFASTKIVQIENIN